MSWALDWSGHASNQLPNRFANSDPRHAFDPRRLGRGHAGARRPRHGRARLRPARARLRRLLHRPGGARRGRRTIRSGCGSTAARTSSTSSSGRSRSRSRWWRCGCSSGCRHDRAARGGGRARGARRRQDARGPPAARGRAGRDRRLRRRPAGRRRLRDVGALAAGLPRAGRPRPARVARRDHRPRHVVRLPPPAHAPQLPHDAVDHRHGARGRRDGRAQPADRLGRAPPRAPRPRRPRRRSAQPGRRPRARARRLALRREPGQA